MTYTKAVFQVLSNYIYSNMYQPEILQRRHWDKLCATVTKMHILCLKCLHFRHEILVRVRFQETPVRKTTLSGRLHGQKNLYDDSRCEWQSEWLCFLSYSAIGWLPIQAASKSKSTPAQPHCEQENGWMDMFRSWWRPAKHPNKHKNSHILYPR